MPDTASVLRCPACRTRQPWQETCRRCRADLTLYVRALRQHERLLARCREAIERGDRGQALRAAGELVMLRPGPDERGLLREAERIEQRG